MDHYIEIKLKANAEMRENVFLNKLYAKLHKKLIDFNCSTIGVSFPGYKTMLGSVIRLHGNASELGELQVVNWLGSLNNYCAVSELRKVPSDAQHRVISRKQSNMTQAKLNRLIKRGTIATEEIKNYREKMFAQGLDNPYLELESVSNGNKYRRYISFGELQPNIVVGVFDSFGLSKKATVPWF